MISRLAAVSIVLNVSMKTPRKGSIRIMQIARIIRLPVVMRLARASILNVMAYGIIEPPRFAPRTSNSPKCILISPLEVREAMIRTAASDECSIHVIRPATSRARSGSFSRGFKIRGSVSD